MDDWSIVGIILIVLVVVVSVLMVFRFGGEDSWIQDSRGVWIKHGNPSKVPEHVLEQHRLIDASLELYSKLIESRVEINSQCLGVVGDYAVDIVSVPRSVEDDLAENQCVEFNSGVVGHFIELDRGGQVVRIV